MNQAESDMVEVDGVRSMFHKLLKIKNDGPPNGVLTFEQNLETLHLSEASQLLIEREEHLFWEKPEEEAHPEEEIEALTTDYSKLKELVLNILVENLSFNPGEVSTEALTSAMKAVYQEEQQDQLWKRRDRTPPTWRPCDWKKIHDSMLRSLVEGRMAKCSNPPGDQLDQSSLEKDLINMGRQLKEDLLYVVSVVKLCYPPEMNICNFYTRMYHQTFSARLRKVTDFGLDDKDCTLLLCWVNEYYPEILQKPELACEIDAAVLEKLLPEDLLKPLEEQYLSRKQHEMMTYMGRILDLEEQRWNNGEELKKEDGSFVSFVAIDIIQCVNDMVTSAGKVVGDLHKARSLTCQLNDFMHRFRTSQDDVITQHRPHSHGIVKANLAFVKHFRDFLLTKSHLFTEEVMQNCVNALNDMKQSAHTYLLSPVHEILKPQYRKLGTDDWLNKTMFEDLLVCIERNIEDLHGLTESCHQELICQFHQEVTAEYVKRLLKGQVKLKDKEQQHRACTVVKGNAESLHSLFSEKGSTGHWLKDILTMIAEVLKLQDLPAIQMQVAALGSRFPDLSEKHASALLKLKTNLSKSDRRTVKETLSVVLREISVADASPFFSTVHVK